MPLVLGPRQVIGAATAVPLVAETAEVQAPFIAAGAVPAAVFYTHRTSVLGFRRDEPADFYCLPRTSLLETRTCPVYLGESVLLPEYRGQGIGVRFFAER